MFSFAYCCSLHFFLRKLSITYTNKHPPTHTHAYTHMQTCTHLHTITPTSISSISHTGIHSLANTLTQTHANTQAHTPTHIQAHAHIRKHTHSHANTYSHTQTHAFTHSLTRKNTHTHAISPTCYPDSHLVFQISSIFRLSFSLLIILPTFFSLFLFFFLGGLSNFCSNCRNYKLESVFSC